MTKNGDGPKDAQRRGFGSDAMRKRAFDLKVKNSIEQKTLGREKILAEIEFIDAEIKRLGIRRRELKSKLDEATLKVLNLQRKAELLMIKKANLCPSCHIEHVQSPPDECWLKIHGASDEKRKAFNEYLKKNKWGVLF